MASLSPAPKLQFFDANGSPLVGGKLYSYQAGTTTPLDTYTNYGGVTLNTNPVILDSRGEANVWLGSALYKFKLTTSTDVEVWTVDNISSVDALAALAASGGSALVGFVQTGAGAQARTVQAKLRDFVDVRDFGASTAASATVNAAAINAAIQANLTGEIRIAEMYSINAAINLNGFNGTIRFTGNGSGLTAAVNNLKVFESTTNAYGCKILDAYIVGTGRTGIYAFDLTRFQLAAAEIVRPRVLDCEYGIYLRSLCWALKIDNPDFDGTDYPITLVEGCNAVEINHPCIDNFGVVGIWVKDGGVLPNVGNLILNGFIQNGTEGIVDQGIQTQVIGTYFEGNSVADVSLKNSSGNFYGCATNHTAGGARAYRASSADAAMIVHPFMSSGARTIGLLDFDGTNTNCYYDVIFGTGSRNLPLGIVTGIQPLSNKPGPIGGVTPDSGAFTTLSATGVAALAAGVNSAKGNVNTTTAVASTIFTLSGTAGAAGGRYDIVAFIGNSGSAANYTASATAFWDGSQARIVSSNGAQLTITLSGANVQVTQTSGLAQIVYWAYTFTSIA
jgi:hypothetical protein